MSDNDECECNHCTCWPNPTCNCQPCKSCIRAAAEAADEVLRRRREVMPDYDKKLEEWLS